MFVCGMTRQRANCFILVGSSWLIARRCIPYMFWESLYVLLTIIMPGEFSCLVIVMDTKREMGVG